MRQEPESAKSVVDGDDDDTLCHQLCGVVIPATASGEAASVNPHEHGQILFMTTIVQTGHRDVEVQAVLVLKANREALRLWATGRERRRIADTVPFGWRPRSPPPQSPNRRSGIWQSAKDIPS